METKRQEDIRKLMQMPEEAIASLNESEADRLGRLAVMFYKETGDGVYKEKAEQIRAAQGELPEDICAMPFFMEYDKEICSAPLYIIFFRIFARNLLKTNQIYAYET